MVPYSWQRVGPIPLASDKADVAYEKGRLDSLRLITRVAVGFKKPEALNALAGLSRGGHRPELPGPNHRMRQESPNFSRNGIVFSCPGATRREVSDAGLLCRPFADLCRARNYAEETGAAFERGLEAFGFSKR